jgi:hypothetical protein
MTTILAGRTILVSGPTGHQAAPPPGRRRATHAAEPCASTRTFYPQPPAGASDVPVSLLPLGEQWSPV